jgi:TolA-binding protein
MKRWLLAGLTVVTLQGWSAETVSSTPNSVQTYLDDLQVKLDHTAQRANQPNAGGSSVVGLRGKKQDASKPLYWKTPDGSTAVRPEEVKAFRDAVEAARQGHTADAVTALKNFKEKHPHSALLPDVDETLKRLQ